MVQFESGLTRSPISSGSCSPVCFAPRAPVFRLGYSPFVNPRMVGRVRAISVAESGGVEIKLISACEGSPLAQVRSGELEAGLLLLPVAQCELSIEPLWSEPLQTVLPAGHPLVRKRRLWLRDLAMPPVLTLSTS